MNRLDAIRLVIERINETDIMIHSNGAISRESCYCKDRPRNFYLLGSMGLASSVGLGIALHYSDHRVVILDGDGNLLMGLGNLAMIGALKPGNLIHIVLDNQVYGTTGNQPTLSPRISLYQMARASGYQSAHHLKHRSEFQKIFSRISKEPGPHFIQFRVDPQVTQDCPRLPYSAREIKERFLGSL